MLGKLEHQTCACGEPGLYAVSLHGKPHSNNMRYFCGAKKCKNAADKLQREQHQIASAKREGKFAATRSPKFRESGAVGGHTPVILARRSKGNLS